MSQFKKRLREESAKKTSTPILQNVNANYTTQYCTYKKIDENTIIGSIVIRGSIQEVLNEGYARIDLNIQELKNSNFNGWDCFAIVQEAYGATNGDVFNISAVDPGILGIQQSSGITALTWKTTNMFYIKAGFVFYK